MKQIIAEDLHILSKLFKNSLSQLLVFAPEDEQNFNRKTFISQAALKSFLQQFPEGQFTIVNLSNAPIQDLVELSCVWTVWNFGNAFSTEDSFSLRYINNSDGSMRWLYPEQSKRPDFLNLYNGSGLRARLISVGFKAVWKLGLDELFSSGQFSVYSKIELPAEQYLAEVEEGNWSLFTGTKGENRKLVLQKNEGTKTKSFLKIPCTEKAAKLVENEAKMLQAMKDFDFKKSVLPQVKAQVDAIELSNVKPTQSKNSTRLYTPHLEALVEWYEQSATLVNQEELKQFTRIENCINRLKKIEELSNDISLNTVKKMTNQLEQLLNRMRYKDQFTVGLAHGDFTPWNLFYKEDKIYVYDWELAEPNLPLLFDAFHFIFQAGVLIEKAGFDVIDQRLTALKNDPIITKLCKQFLVDFDSSRQFYLLYTISYYLDLYVVQNPLHFQAHWLIDCWAAALDKEMKNSEPHMDLIPLHAIIFPKKMSWNGWKLSAS